MKKNSSPMYIGLLSGTSMDGIDAALVSFDETPNKINVIATHLEEIPEKLRTRALKISLSADHEDFTSVAELDIHFGHLFANAANTLLKKANVAPSNVVAIGSHGQTLWHHPHPPTPFTLQIGDPNIIAKQTGITTVADFRRGDMALGGQGAPLVPPFHAWLFGNNSSRIILNIGGIANITLLPFEGQHILGFDTGPGNGLMDAWTTLHLSQPYDKDGAFAKQGKCHMHLLEQFLNDPYFKRHAPKSTGKDYFNLAWLNRYLASFSMSVADVQATLLALTALSISLAINAYRKSGEVILCGGGSRNPVLIEAIAGHLGKDFTLVTTENYGIDPKWLEAACFAWLAKKRLENQPIDLTKITGATKPTILGGTFSA